MKAFIKSIDESTWVAVEERCSPIVEIDARKNQTKKKKISWSPEKMHKANVNGKALNAILRGVNENQIKCTATCDCAIKA